MIKVKPFTGLLNVIQCSAEIESEESRRYRREVKGISYRCERLAVLRVDDAPLCTVHAKVALLKAVERGEDIIQEGGND